MNPYVGNNLPAARSTLFRIKQLAMEAQGLDLFVQWPDNRILVEENAKQAQSLVEAKQASIGF